MAKDKKRTTFTGKRHSLPYSTEIIYQRLNELEFITEGEVVRRGRFWTAKRNKKNEIVGYDENTRAYVIVATKRFFGQRFFVPALEDKLEYREKIEECLPVGRLNEFQRKEYTQNFLN